MLRFSIVALAIAAVVTVESHALGQYGTSSLDTIARSLEDISFEMRSEAAARRRDQASGNQGAPLIGDQLVYYQQLIATLNQRLNVVAINANAAVSGWQKAEQHNRRLMESNKKLEAEVARLKRENRRPQPDDETKKRFEAYEKFAKATIAVYSTAVAENRPELIEQHVLHYWQITADVKRPNPRLKLQITDAAP